MSTGDCLASGAIEVGDSGLDIHPRRCRFVPLQVSPAARVAALVPRYTRRTGASPWLHVLGTRATAGKSSALLADRGTREHSSDASSADPANAGRAVRARRPEPLRGGAGRSPRGRSSLGGRARPVALAAR